MGHAEARREKRRRQGHWSKTTKWEHDRFPPSVAVITFHLHYLNYSDSPPPGLSRLDDLPLFFWRRRPEITCWQSNQWRTGPSQMQMSSLSSSLKSRVVFLFVPSSWKESVIQTNSEVSRNYRLVSTDFHQQLCMWWSSRNVNESSIGVNQLQAPPQHSPTKLVAAAAVKCTLWWWGGRRTVRRYTTRLSRSVLPLGFIKEKCFPGKIFYFLVKVYVRSLQYSWLGVQSLHLIRRAISSWDRPPRGSRIQRNSSANGSWWALCSF